MAGLQGILKWSLSQTDTGNVAGVGDEPGYVLPQRTEAEKSWLSSALQSLSVDEAGRMRELGRVLQSLDVFPANDASLAHPEVQASEAKVGGVKLAALEELQDLVESMDNAKDLFMVGAVGPLLDCVRGVPPVAGVGEGGLSVARVHGSTLLPVRTQACLVVGTVVANNPAAQSWALRAGTLPLLLAVLTREGAGLGSPESLALQAAATGALANLLRGCQEAQAELLATSGCPGMAPLWQPLQHWREYFSGGGGGGNSNAAIERTAAGGSNGGSSSSKEGGFHGRKLLRRLAILLRHLVAGGFFPEAAMAGLMASPTAPGAIPTLMEVLVGCGIDLIPRVRQHEEGQKEGGEGEEGSHTTLPEATDGEDVRGGVLGCLRALGLPAQPPDYIAAGADGEAYGDKRTPRGLYDDSPGSVLERGGGGSGGGAGAALLMGDGSSGGGGGVGGGGGLVGGAPGVPTVLSLDTRVASLKAAGAGAALRALAKVCAENGREDEGGEVGEVAKLFE